MKRIVWIVVVVVAAVGIGAAPAIAGLVGNSSFSRNIPVRIPTQARTPRQVDGHGPATDVLSTAGQSPRDESGDVGGRSRREPGPGEAQRGDERRGARNEPEPGNNSSGASGELEPGEGGVGARRQPEPADGHRGDSGEPSGGRGGPGT